MKRVIVLGCSGAGKSTFARRLARALAAPCVHLDALFWDAGWIACAPEEFRRRVAVALAGEAWVVDGNYLTASGDLSVPRAEAIVYLHQPRWLCLLRVFMRYLRHAGGRAREDIAPGCPEKIDLPFLTWIWNFERTAPASIARVLVSHDATGRFVRLDGDRAARAYLTMIAAPVGAPEER
jgi:adenylate kinase family enzyme